MTFSVHGICVPARLHDVTATFAPGTITCVVGENGAGKSTLLDVMAGLVKPARGVVQWGDDDVRALSHEARARTIASLGTDAIDDDDLSVASRIAQGLVPRRGVHALFDDVTATRVHAVAQQVGVAQLLERRVGSLSTGERRRVQWARALIDDAAPVVLLDEPHAGVDLKHQLLVNQAVRACAARGAVVVVTVHELALAWRLADQVLALRAGAVVACGAREVVVCDAGVDAIYGVQGARVVQVGDSVAVVVPEGAESGGR
jgi:iron complex transport system ATP-binding protein